MQEFVYEVWSESAGRLGRFDSRAEAIEFFNEMSDAAMTCGVQTKLGLYESMLLETYEYEPDIETFINDLQEYVNRPS